MIDRYTKIVLTFIAMGLWAHLIVPVVKPLPASAQDANWFLRSIDSKIGNLVNGVCINSKLC